jgi:hypothetical protein
MIAAKMDAWMPATPVATAPPSRRDPWGLRMGWRGYEAFSRLNTLSDAELSSRGLTRGELPRLALAAMRAGR